MNCLPKTQFLANTKVVVLEMTPAQLPYLKVFYLRERYKDGTMAAVTITVKM